jgi:serine/threonine-protein kinase
MGRLVMLKTIVTAGGQTDQKALRRFMREAKAGGRLSHPSIIELYDVNEQGDLMYIVMEFIEGETLESMLKAKGHLPASTVVRYMAQIGDALKYAHEQQIIHRDIRPATIMVRTEDDRAKLTDFTLAKNLERAAFSVITADGEAIGTPYYMPPEQVKSAKAADTRSDIYSYCATFYHLLSGKFPIEARSYGEFITKVFGADAPQLKDVAPGIPPKLANLIQKGLARDPNHRWQDMEGLLAELMPIQKAVGAAG